MYFQDIILQDDLIFENYTKKYLVPSLKVFGASFANLFHKLDKIAFGIGDFIADICGSFFKEVVFILVKVNPYLQYVMERLKQMGLYEYDYCFDNIIFGKYHVIVIQYPTVFKNSYYEFLNGNYSKMFTPQQVTVFFANEDTVAVLQKNHIAKQNFKKKLELCFDTKITDFEEVNWREFELPICKKQEYFNYNLLKNEK